MFLDNPIYPTANEFDDLRIQLIRIELHKLRFAITVVASNDDDVDDYLVDSALLH